MKYLFLAAALFCGCQTSLADAPRFDPEGAPPEFFAAVDRWYEATGLQFDIGPRGVRVRAAPAETVWDWCGGEWMHACTAIYKSDRRVEGIVYRQDWSGDKLMRVLTHELGHVLLRELPFNADAHHAVPGIMYDWAAPITAELLDVVCELNPCQWKHPEREAIDETIEDVRDPAAETGSP